MTTTDINIADEIKAVVAAMVGGVRYGVKIRLPHAVVMTLMFRRDQSVSNKIKTILRLTKDHAVSLATFATIYKTMLVLLKTTSRVLQSSSSSVEKHNVLRRIGRFVVQSLFATDGRRLVDRPAGYPESNRHALIAGAVGGYYIFGRHGNKVNVQINLYLFSRIIMALGHRYGMNAMDPSDNNRYYPWFAATIWGIVMFLFEEDPDTLQPSLKMSMNEIYRFMLQKLE